MVTVQILLLLLVCVFSTTSSMETNDTMCNEDCNGYSFPTIPQSQQVYGFGIHVEFTDESFLQKHLLSFPCPPAWWPHFCSDFIDKRQFGLSLSCQDITTILEICLAQTQEKSYIYLLSDCKQHLECQKFKSLCSSKKYSSHCIDDYGTSSIVPPFIVDTEENGHTSNKHMNNTTEIIIMKQSGANSEEYYDEPYNWNVLWVLLVLVYIFIFVPCFLNFVIKRSIIDRLRNRCQRNRRKTVKKNFEDDEPPLIPVVNKEVHSPVGAENSMFIPSRPDSMASSIGEDFDFPFADQSAAISMVSLLIDEPR